MDLDLAIVFATPLVLFCRLYFQFYRWKRPLRERRLHVFRVLVASHRAPISSERVQALNLVEVEFYKIDAVQLAYRNLLELINPKPIPLAFADDFSKRLTMLLSAMAKVLGYNLEQIEVLDGGYYPQGFFDEQAEIRAVRQAFVEVLSGQRPLLVSPEAPTPTQPFPPPAAPT